MKITILLPAYNNYPVGGFKVQYEYANRLQARGHSVTLVFPQMVEGITGWKRPLRRLRWAYNVRRRNRPLIGWFPLDPKVKTVLAADLCPQHVPDADAVIATGWPTAEMIAHYPNHKGVRFYMIYDYEYWMTTEDQYRARLENTFRAGLHMIATSPAVQHMLSTNGAVPVAYVPCGLDFSVYGIDIPIEDRAWGTVGFPVRPETFKGTEDAVEAVRQLRQQYGDRVRVKAFGSIKDPALPEWVEYHYRPTDAELRNFYNSLSVFLFPSHHEGWGLTGTEALACGASLVASDSVGLRDYALDGETALLVPPKRPDLLADAMDRLFRDEELRCRLARQGNQHVQQYHWERAVDDFEAVLTRHTARGLRN